MDHSLNQTLTYILHFLVGEQERTLLLQPIDAANGVILEETSEDSGIVRGKSIYGRTFDLKFTQILRIEEYDVTANWGGNGHKTRRMTEKQIVDYTKNCGGEASKISKIKDTKGKVVFDKDDKT